MEADEILQLGGSIELSGFNNIDGGKMIVLKKIIGNYARKIGDKTNKFEKLSINMKEVHSTEKNKIFETHAKVLDNGKAITSSVTDRNLFIAVDAALKHIDKQIHK